MWADHSGKLHQPGSPSSFRPSPYRQFCLKVLDASRLLAALVNTSLETLNRLADLIDDRGCEDVPAEAERT